MLNYQRVYSLKDDVPNIASSWLAQSHFHGESLSCISHSEVYPVAWWLNPAYRWEPIRMLLLRINQDDYFSYAYMHSHVYIHMFIILICPRVINKVSTCVGVTIWL